MFSTLAGMMMAVKVHFYEMKYPIMKKNDTGVAESIYFNKVVDNFQKHHLTDASVMTWVR